MSQTEGSGSARCLVAILFAAGSAACTHRGAAAPSATASALPVLETGSQHPMPDEWIDRDTRHRVRKLVVRDGANMSFFFTSPAFVPRRVSADGLMVFHGTTTRGQQLFAIDLQSRIIRQLTDRDGGVSDEVVAPGSGQAFYQSHDSIVVIDLRSGASRLVTVLPAGVHGSISTVNADATLLAGASAGPEAAEILEKYPARADYFDRLFAAHVPYSLWTLDVTSGAITTVHRENAWLAHLQFSPTDPALLLFSREGPWHLVDRIWTIDLRSGAVTKIHTRSGENEIAGHEFWSPDGRTIWYDVQTPKGVTFHLSGVDVASGTARVFDLERDDWGIHFNISPDQTLFANDGGDSSQVARAQDGRWLHLLRPEGKRLVAERLVNLSHQVYRRTEPHVQFSPDSRWVVFRGNFDGDVQIYSVEVERTP